MSLFTIGRLCLKLAGRDAGRKCVVVELVNDHFVVVDGNVRRKKVNVKHLEPLAEVLSLKSKASHDEVKTAFEKLGFPVWERKSREAKERPKKQKKAKSAPENTGAKPKGSGKVSGKKTAGSKEGSSLAGTSETPARKETTN